MAKINKEQQDLAWGCLPKEFKEEVKKIYGNSIWITDWDQGYKDAMENFFGIHNLTSDAEGEDDEMLYVSRKRVQDIYAQCKTVQMDDSPNLPAETIDAASTKMALLSSLFGSKCLPDEVADEDNFATKEPKYYVGQRMYIKYINKIGTIDVVQGYNEEEDGIYYHLKVEPKGGATVREENLQPYEEPKPAEPTDNPIPPNSGELKSQEADNHFDNIHKDGFSKERRLNIATQMVSAYIHCEGMTDPSLIATIAFQLADALIAESEKGDSK